MNRSHYLSLIIAGLLLSCGDDAGSNHTPAPARTYLVSATATQDIPLETLLSFAKLSGHKEFEALVKYGVKTYTMVYKTTYQGKTIEASGLLYVPQQLEQPAPLISLQHGTTFVKDDAPSVSGSFTGMEYFASAGYIAIMPDYIGYGQSAHIFHPYYVEQYSAGAVIDMIKSAKEFLADENIHFTDQLFLAGYSEGGYVTLAAAHELDTNPTHGLSVTAVAAGAGGYDLTEMLHSVITQPHYAYPSYLAFVLMSYNTTFNWNLPLTYFFQDKYAQALNTYMNGQHHGSYINSKLTTQVSALLNPDLLKRLKTPEGEATLKAALQENSVTGWSTGIPIRLYHGTRDEIIPYQNSEITLEHFKAAGSTSVDLTLISGGTHGSSFVPMLQQFVPWFESLRKPGN
jgi:pimeloyl-ACP methyl ester carboxylesterase